MLNQDELTEFQERLGSSPKAKIQSRGNPPTEACVAPQTAQPSSYGDYVQWRVMSNGVFTAIGDTRKELPTGVFSIDVDGHTGAFLFITRTVITDDLVVLPDSASSRILAAVDTFWAARERFRSFGQLYKRGIMLWGPPGGGKTATLTLLSQDLLQRGGIVVLASHPVRTARGLEVVRRVEPERPLICVLEDIDEIISEHGEHELLALLDGESQVDNVLFIATTNYPERLDKRLINRPSRFDEIIKVGMPSALAREVYLRSRLSEQFDSRWVKDTEGFSVAHLRELVVAVYCLDRDYGETIERLRRMAYTPKSEGGNSAGFLETRSSNV